jgi:basic membrane lipoprotein Med (substrate-binding protein (PBP1-ABC) superfamily)
MSKTTRLLMGLLAVLALVAAACGSDDATDEAATTTAPAAEDDAMEDDEPVEDDAMEEEDDAGQTPDTTEPPEPPVDADTQALIDQFDIDGDGTVTIGVAAAGPRDDGGYVEGLVGFTEDWASENGFPTPIVVDNIGADEAAQSMSDLAQQGVDLMFVGASEIAEPLGDLTEAFPDIFWYCNCGAGFEELPGLAQATDWGAAIHYTGGVAIGQALLENGGNKAVFLGCCDLNFENEALEATRAGMASVDASFTMDYVATGDFPFDFANSGNATAAFATAIADGATVAYAYLDGALEPVAQAATEAGIDVFAAGPADVCSRDDGIDWTGSIVFDGGLYAAEGMNRIVDGSLTEGSTYQFPTQQGLNGGILCDGSADATAAIGDSFGLLAAFDEDLMGQLGAISGAAYAGG